jgi:FtsP/CotA-like multicopper oxidase with cupredoxin domain
MSRHGLISRGLLAAVLGLLALPAGAQSFRVQCPASTITHPSGLHDNSSEPAYAGPTGFTQDPTGKFAVPSGNVNGAIKCQQISGGDGYATMADGTQTYMFSFGPLSGLTDIANGQSGTEFPNVFNDPYLATSATALPPGFPAVSPASGPVAYNGAIGLASNVAYTFSIFDISESGHVVTVVLNTASPFKVGDQVAIGQGTGNDLAGYVGTFTVTAINVTNAFFQPSNAFQYSNPNTGLAAVNMSPDGTASSPAGVDGHVDPRQAMDVGVMNGNIPAPLMAIDEDDEFFLTLTNVGMIMRPDLFEQHTIHFHGYPNASSFYDGVPDASVAINIGASFTYYYLAPDAGTYFFHCHITPPEHLQMGMVGQLYVRPRQNRVARGSSLYASLQAQQNDKRTACDSSKDILCSNPLPAVVTIATGGFDPTNAVDPQTKKYAYNDGDGSTYYDVEYPLQIHGFDPNFHFVGMTFNPEGFTDMKDKYFLLNGRSYPDTVAAGPQQTQSADGVLHDSQPMPSIIKIAAGTRALLRISSLSVSEYETLASLGIPMQVIGYNAKLLRDQAGHNLYYGTNSITLGGGESLDVILDTCTQRATQGDPSSACTTPMAAGTYYLYTPNLDHLSNDAENFGGLMTEVTVF